MNFKGKKHQQCRLITNFEVSRWIALDAASESAHLFRFLTIWYICEWHFNWLILISKFFFRVLKPPGGGSSDIFGTADLNKPAAGTKSNHSDHFGSGSGFGGDLSDLGVKASSVDSNDGASTPSQTSTSNGSPNNSEPNTPRSGKQLEKYERILSSVFCFFAVLHTHTLCFD